MWYQRFWRTLLCYYLGNLEWEHLFCAWKYSVCLRGRDGISKYSGGSDSHIYSEVCVTWPVLLPPCSWMNSFLTAMNLTAHSELHECVLIEQEDAGLEWAQGSTTLPCPPKRSLQTIGIPEPIRQHFQVLPCPLYLSSNYCSSAVFPWAFEV